MAFQLKGQGALLRRLEAIKKPRPLLRAMQMVTVREAKLRVNRATGHTARTIHAGTLTDTYATVEAAGAAVWLERGTRPHIIRAKPGGVLAWPATAAGRRKSGRANSRALKGAPGLGAAGGGFGGITIKRVGGRGRSSGTFRYARMVKHPGTKPSPFLLPAAKEAIAKAGINPMVKSWNEAA